MDHFEKYDEYIENLLLAQFEVSKIIQHHLTRGEAREDFLKNIVLSQFKQLLICKGFLSNGTRQSNQCDIIVIKNTARVTSLGSHNIVNTNDGKMVLEVKSNATGSDFKNFNNQARRIKNLCMTNKPLCGMFCYCINLQEETILRRFGYKFNNLNESFEFENSIILKYPYIDFVLSLHKIFDEELQYNVIKQFFIRWDNNNKRYLLWQRHPVSKNFFDLINSINLG